jgi:hypothetical protein
VRAQVEVVADNPAHCGKNEWLSGLVTRKREGFAGDSHRRRTLASCPTSALNAACLLVEQAAELALAACVGRGTVVGEAEREPTVRSGTSPEFSR